MTLPPLGVTRTFAVVSAYHAPADLVSRCVELLAQVEYIGIVDDGSHSLGPLQRVDERIVLIDLPENRGIAGALNVGLTWAAGQGATHVLVLDQDSIVPPGYVRAMHEALREKQSEGAPVAAVVPATVEGDRITTIGGSSRPLDPIQSGQIILVDAIRMIGTFDERFVIDAVDSEYTLRARSRGFELFTAPRVELGHSLGELEPLMFRGRHRSVLGRPRYWRYHPPFRTYYMVRNGLALWRMHRRGNMRWLLRRTAYLVVDVTYTSLAAPDRRAQFTAVAHALRDTLRRRLGRIPPATLAAIDRRRPTVRSVRAPR